MRTGVRAMTREELNRCERELQPLVGWRYRKYKLKPDLVLLGTWLWLGVTIAAYFLYLISGNTSSLWSRGLWFSENDVLHIGLIIWMFYIAFALAPCVKDLQNPA